MAGETALGILLLLGGRSRPSAGRECRLPRAADSIRIRVWLWCIPALSAPVYLAHKDTTTIWGEIEDLLVGDGP
jgi:hypothetical protein